MKPQYRDKLDVYYKNHEVSKGLLILTNELTDNVPKPQDGDYWGDWWLADNKQYLLFKRNNIEYDIELSRAKTQSQMFIWLMHMADKRWISAEDLGQLTYAFHDMFQIYGR